MKTETRVKNIEVLIMRCRGVIARQDKALSTEDQFSLPLQPARIEFQNQ